jgi:hypothetical protein
MSILEREKTDRRLHLKTGLYDKVLSLKGMEVR